MEMSSRLDDRAGSAILPRAGALEPRARVKRRARSRRLVWGGVTGVVIVSGATWFALHRGPQPAAVQMATVGREDLQAKVTANGRVQAQKKVDLSATVAGQVTHLAVKEGDRVRRGQFLLQIDATNPRAAARSSEASMQALLRDVDSARARLDQARLDSQRAEENHRVRFVVQKFGVIRSRDEFLAALKRRNLDWNDFERLKANLTLAEAVAADASSNSVVKRRDRRLSDVQVHGTTANYGPLMRLDITAGRYFTPAEEQGNLDVAVIGWDIKDELFGPLDPVGREMLVGSGSYRVIGVVAQQGRTLGQSQDDQLWMPMGSYRRASATGARSTLW